MDHRQSLRRVVKEELWRRLGQIGRVISLGSLGPIFELVGSSETAVGSFDEGKGNAKANEIGGLRQWALGSFMHVCSEAVNNVIGMRSEHAIGRGNKRMERFSTGFTGSFILAELGFFAALKGR